MPRASVVPFQVGLGEQLKEGLADFAGSIFCGVCEVSAVQETRSFKVLTYVRVLSRCHCRHCFVSDRALQGM